MKMWALLLMLSCAPFLTSMHVSVRIAHVSLVHKCILYYHILLREFNLNSIHVRVECNDSAHGSCSDVSLILGGR